MEGVYGTLWVFLELSYVKSGMFGADHFLDDERFDVPDDTERFLLKLGICCSLHEDYGGRKKET